MKKAYLEYEKYKDTEKKKLTQVERDFIENIAKETKALTQQENR